MTASSLAPGSIAPFERVGASIVSAISEEAVTFSGCFDRRLARPAAVEPHFRVRDAEGVIDAVPKLFKGLLLDIGIDVAGSAGPNSSLLARGCVARLICRAPKVFMQKQSRQQLKFQALLVRQPLLGVVAGRAHFARHHLSENERILWQQLSGKKLGVAFRRQVPIGNYIVDFVAPSARLIVEVDDRSHELKRAADARRDRNLGRLGYRVLRLPAELVRGNLAEAVARIVAALSVAT